MAVYIALVASLLFCVCTVLYCRRYVRAVYGEIDRILDAALQKNAHLRVPSADSRLSKLAHKAARITEMYVSDAALAQAEKATVQSLIADMSHQIKTPLAGVGMYASLLLEGGLTADEQHAFLSRIRTGADRLQWMMDGLIKLSRLETGAIQLQPAKAAFKQTLSNSISNVLPAAAKKNIQISVQPFEDLPLLHDRRWTAESLGNILENAVKYSPENGRIEVSLEHLAIYTKITVTDNGIGFAEDERNDLFKRFYRGENAKAHEGAGLGLYLASLIMEKQNGYIVADTKEGAGASFSLFFLNAE